MLFPLKYKPDFNVEQIEKWEAAGGNQSSLPSVSGLHTQEAV